MENLVKGLFAERIRRLRRDSNFTQSDLAESVGVELSTYQRWETGKTIPSEGNFQELARVLKVTPTYLVGGSVPEKGVGGTGKLDRLSKIEVGKNIKYFRDTRGLSQEAFAEAIGVERGTVSKWERGVITPNGERRKRLTSFFKLPWKEIAYTRHFAKDSSDTDSLLESHEKRLADIEQTLKGIMGGKAGHSVVLAPIDLAPILAEYTEWDWDQIRNMLQNSITPHSRPEAQLKS